MLLTDTAVRQAKPKKKLYNLCDGRGLSLQVAARGSKRWEFRFQWYAACVAAAGLFPARWITPLLMPVVAPADPDRARRAGLRSGLG